MTYLIPNKSVKIFEKHGVVSVPIRDIHFPLPKPGELSRGRMNIENLSNGAPVGYTWISRGSTTNHKSPRRVVIASTEISKENLPEHATKIKERADVLEVKVIEKSSPRYEHGNRFSYGINPIYN